MMDVLYPVTILFAFVCNYFYDRVMMYELMQKMLTRKEDSRKVNSETDIEISPTHQFNYDLSKIYIQKKYVLDVGCWTGQYEKLAKKIVKKIVGIDPNTEAIQFAKKTISGPKFIVGTALNLPFKKSSFDVVTLLDVIEHIPNKTESTCLNEIARVLKPNGILILSTNNKHPIAVFFDPAFWGFGHRHYSNSELRHLLSQAGFTIVEIINSGGFWRISSFVVDMIFKHIFRTKLAYPKYIKKKISNDFKNNGIMTTHIIARLR